MPYRRDFKFVFLLKLVIPCYGWNYRQKSSSFYLVVFDVIEAYVFLIVHIVNAKYPRAFFFSTIVEVKRDIEMMYSRKSYIVWVWNEKVVIVDRFAVVMKFTGYDCWYCIV